MKKIILSAASLAVAAVASVSVAPTTSEAIPAFARQTGSACLACHFQSFPTLSAYGRAFKMGALTDAAQDLVEDEHLSIPSVINWTVMVRPQFESVKTTPTVGAATTANTMAVADTVFMIGGRAGEHTGTFLEVAIEGAGSAFGNVQMFNSWDMGDLKVGATVWADGFGEDSGLQLMSVWGQHGGMLGGKSLSINNSMGANDAQGVTFWAGSDVWAAQLAMVNIVTPGAGFGFSPTLRGNYFLDAGDWEVGLGLIAVTGSAGATGATQDTKRTGLDVQAFGEVADMEIGVFADWATAPTSSATAVNVYNPSTTDTRSGYSVRVSVKPMAQVIFLAGIGAETVSTVTTDKLNIGVEYEFYQNFAIQLVYNSTDDGTTKVASTLLDLELLI